MRAMISKRISELSNLSSISRVVSANPEWKQYVISKTKFLDHTIKFAERIYCVVNDIQSHPLCHCGNKLKFRHWSKGYLETCSFSCYRKIHPTEKTIEKNRKKEQAKKNRENQKRNKELIKQNKESIDWIKKKKKELNLLGSTIVKIENTLQEKWTFRCLTCSNEYKRLPQNEVKSIKRSGTPACSNCRTKLTYNGVGIKRNELEQMISMIGMKLEDKIGDIVKNHTKLKFRCTNCDGIFKRNPLWIEKTKSSECTKCIKRNSKLLSYDFVKSEIEKDGNELLSENYEGKKNGKRTLLSIRCKNCKRVYEQSWFVYRTRGVKQCQTCAVSDVRKQNGSKQEKLLAKYIQSKGIKIVKSDKVLIAPKEIDILAPDHNIGIEVNGLYWHSSQFKDRKYHLSKTVEAKKKGIQLLHFYEDEIIEKPDIVKSMIDNKLGITSVKIFARKCKIEDVSNKVANEFLQLNHIQGPCKSKLNKALTYNNEIVAVMQISKSRFSKKHDYELTRFATKLGTTITGGFSRLLKSFNLHGLLISYADRRYSEGKVYEANGFRLVNTTDPGYFYSKGLVRFNRQKFQKHKLEKILETFDPNLTESENMKNNNYLKIWDCGQLVYEKIL